jgi:hypothetical protein
MEIVNRGLPFEWACPFCGQIALITNANYYSSEARLGSVHREDDLGFRVDYEAIVCPNPRCKKFGLVVQVVGHGTYQTWQLVPAAKEFPSYIPQAILDDYREACFIKDLSPRAAATLARRCLQGMIRDFWNVRGKHSLADEIGAIEDKIDPLTKDAIDAVRKVGNIAAHMEQDPNLVIDVEPGEAGQLISLIPE